MDLKVWCLMDARSKYVSTFDVYAIASRGEGALKGSKKGEAKQGQKVVDHLVEDLHHNGHVMRMDFIYHNGRVIGRFGGQIHICYMYNLKQESCLPKTLSNNKAFAKRPQGPIEWWMHSSNINVL